MRRKHAKPLRRSFRTLTDAKNWVRKEESAILDGKHVPASKARKHTLSDLIEHYIQVHLSKFPKRLKDQIGHLHWWKKHYGNKILIEITPSLLSQAKSRLLHEQTTRKTLRSGSKVNRYLSTLSKAFSLATKEWEWIGENPFSKVSKLPESKGRTRFLSKEELQNLLQACKAHKNPNPIWDGSNGSKSWHALWGNY